MKKQILGVVLLLCLSVPTFALSKQELKDTLKTLDIKDFQEIMQSVQRSAQDSAKLTGYVDAPPYIGAAYGYYSFYPIPDRLNVGNNTQAGSLRNLTGSAAQLMWNVNPALAIGVLWGNMGGSVSNKVSGSYHDYSVTGAFQMVYFKYKPIIEPSYFLDLDFGVGVLDGSYRSGSTNEAYSGSDVFRRGSNWAYMFNADFRYRLSPILFSSVKVGFMGAKLTNLNRAGVVDNGTSLDFSGGFFSLGIGTNF